jgi:transposase
VNLICVASFMAAIGEPSRFLTSRRLVAYLGLDPKVRQSGEAPARSGRITKRGSASARWALVEAAWSVVKHPARCAPAMSAFAPGVVTARRSLRPPANSLSCSGAC